MNTGLVDIGVNLTSRQFHTDRERVIERAIEAGVPYLIVTGLDAALSHAALDLAREFPHALCCTAGVHPHNARNFDRHTPDEISALARHPETVAVGECGLDYERDFSPRPMQRRAFEAQIEIAMTLDKPLFLHERGAHEDFVRILENARRPLVGVVHCFTGGAQELERYLGLGLCIGLTGFVCDERRAKHLWPLVAKIPSDRLMLETDAPFLLPRSVHLPAGRRNEPAFLPHVCARVAELAHREEADVRWETTRAAFGLFRLQDRFGRSFSD